MNLYEFSDMDFVTCEYTGNVYRVIEADNRGMAVLQNVKTDRMEPWNAYNNDRFLPADVQGKLFN